MILDTHSMDKAFKVLEWIKKLNKQSKSKDVFYLSAYANCREQGFALYNLHDLEHPKARWVRFSECRNSDSICVWTGTGKFYDDRIQETDNGKWFNWNEYKKAARFIIAFLEI